MSLQRLLSATGGLLGLALAGLLVIPLFALAMSTSERDLVAGIAHPMFLPALLLSLKTTLISLGLTILMGTPLAWWLASSPSRLTKPVETLIELPIVIPPAVLGVALLQTFGRQGLLGGVLQEAGVAVPFTSGAVIIVQIVVSSPFFIQAAANSFRKVDPDTLIVARTLGSSATNVFFRVVLPVSLPGVTAGVSLAWARAIGEFGATLLFAGNMPGETQTMPLAIFYALESDLRLAVVFSLVLVGTAGIILAGLKALPPLARAFTWGQP